MEILESNKDKFGIDFQNNKKILNEISIVRSKGLKNELAGYITKFIKREIREKEEQLLKESQAAKEVPATDDESIITDDTDSDLQNSTKDELEESLD